MALSVATNQKSTLWERVSADPEIFLLRLPFASADKGCTNSFALHDGGEWLLIDTGTASDRGLRIMEEALSELGIASDNASLFVTHLHLDHSGLIGAAARSVDRVYTSASDRRFLDVSPLGGAREDLLRRARRERFPEREASLFSSVSKYLIPEEKIDVDFVEVSDGDEIAVGARVLRVLSTPGHAQGHLSLFDESAGMLFSGDLVLPDVASFIDVSLDGSDSVKAMQESLEKIRSLSPRRILPSHGDIGFNGSARLEWLISHYERRVEDAVSVIRAHPGLTGYEVIRAMTWSSYRGRWESIPDIQRGFVLREGVAVLDHVAKELVERRADANTFYRYHPRSHHSARCLSGFSASLERRR